MSINKFKENNKIFEDTKKFSNQEIKYAIDSLKNHESSKSWVQELEKKFSEVMGVKYAISCNSGTSGLHAALFAVGVNEGDEVIIPALTVIMDAYAVIHLKATPIFVDVKLDTHLINVEEIEKKITKRTKAIITVSWEGLSCDMDPIMSLAKKHNIKVIDDSARTVLGKYKNKLAGTIADISVFSFESKKHITAGGEGGMIVTNNENLAVQARKFSGIGYKHMTADAGKTHLAIDTVQDPEYKRFDTIGLNYRMNTISAAVALGQVERIYEIVNKRKIIGKMFLESTKGYEWFVPQLTPKNYEHSYYTFSVDYKGEELFNFTWKDFYKLYLEMGGDGFYSPVAIPYTEPSLIGKTFGNNKMDYGLCPISEGLQKRVMCFKTNYRDYDTARKKIDILSSLLYKLNQKL